MKKIVIVASKRQPTQEMIAARRKDRLTAYRKKFMRYETYRQRALIPSTNNFDCSPAGIKRNGRCNFADIQLREAAISIRECLSKSED